MVKKYGLQISQPGLEPYNGLTWKMTERKVDSEVHKETTDRPGWCTDHHLRPCAGFVEIMAPVFSREAWRCVWNMIQNDLVHRWGLDFALQKCVQPPHEKIGVVNSQWIVHKRIPSLGNQGTRVSREDVIIRKTTPFSQEEAQAPTASRYSQKDHSISLRHSLTGMVDQVLTYYSIDVATSPT